MLANPFGMAIMVSGRFHVRNPYVGLMTRNYRTPKMLYSNDLRFSTIWINHVFLSCKTAYARRISWDGSVSGSRALVVAMKQFTTQVHYTIF